MWQLYMVLAVWNGNASIGGPLIVDGFTTEAACIAHMHKIKNTTPKEKHMFITNKYEFLISTCVKVQK